MSSNIKPNVEEHFDDYASTGRWQALLREKVDSNNFPYIIRFDWYKDIMNTLLPDSVLDVGCGSGDFVTIVPNSISRYKGMDISEQMLVATKDIIDKLPQAEQEKYSLVQSSFETYEDSQDYDFILASGFLEYFVELKPIIEKLYQLTSDNGHLAIQVPNREFFRWKGIALAKENDKGFSHHRISGSECDQLMAEAGYTKVQGDYINHYYYPYKRIFPKLHIIFDKLLSPYTPVSFSRKRASMYCGVYKK
ncbi:MAG: class I SAM-dependent methyltransferase [Gammaproteobacteria bacterium]|jgi:predicted TPR repeat methyltransferase|nr:class I SAM-dependent methyltransferase [Gammaproteobacteria bacterium]